MARIDGSKDCMQMGTHGTPIELATVKTVGWMLDTETKFALLMMIDLNVY